MREIASYEAVCEALNALVAEGSDPSIVAVQRRIGGGSYSTVKKHLTAWAEQRAKESISVPAIPAEVVAKTQEFGRAVWVIAAAGAQQEIQKVKASTQAEVVAVRNELTEATGVITRLEGIEAEQSAALDGYQAKLREAELKLVEAQTKAERVAELEKSLADALAAAEQVRNEARDRAVELGTLNGEVKALRNQVRELTAALKR